MSLIETRGNSALLKRAEQLKRWQESDTCRRERRRTSYKPRVQFTDGCVFLAACAASDKEEVRRLISRGADIDTANVDGLTALHQACIDDNLEMVEFLVERGADVNRGDNEGWTPLHATASCGFLSIAKYLLENNCNVAAVNNDGELAIDISESDEMESLLQHEINSRSIDCEASRIVEERMMLEDATKWVESDKFGDVPHQKTGATSLHVAAAKGYIKVIGLLLECHAPINIQDYDGWTPLHAAAHWAQREAIDLLCKNLADMEIKNYVGQTCFDVADPDVLKLLENLKREQITIQKERPDIRNLVNSRPSITSSLSNSGGRRSVSLVSPILNSSSSSNNKNNNINNNNIIVNSNNRNLKIIADDNSDRSSITRLSLDDKELRSKKDSSYERDSLRGSSLVSETIQESNKSNAESDSDVGRKNRANLSENSIPKITLSKEDSPTNKVPGYSPPQPPPEAVVANEKKKQQVQSSSSPTENSADDVHPWRKHASLRSRPVSTTLNNNNNSSSNNNNNKKDEASESDVPLRRIHSFESDEKFYTRLTELREKIRSNHIAASGSSPSSSYEPSSRPYTGAASLSTSRYNSSHTASLPRSVGTKALPSLPESSSLPKPLSSVSQSLTRSSSLRDNSVVASSLTYKPPPSVPYRHYAADTHESPLTPTSQTTITNNLNTLNNNTNSEYKNTIKAPIDDHDEEAPNNIVARNNDNNNNKNHNLNIANNNNQLQKQHKHNSNNINNNTDEEEDEDNFARPFINPLRRLGSSSSSNNTTTTATAVAAKPSDFFSPRPTSLLLGRNIWKRYESDGGSRVKSDSSLANNKHQPPQSHVRRSFVPPVRDEESETQRKAHAKRVRETRRSTQGVTLEDLKSAEQLVKKKQQQENQIRTSELQQLAAAASSCSVGSTATTTVTTSATLVTSTSPASSTPSLASSAYERKPSWRLKTEGTATDKNKFRLEDAGPSETLNALRKSSKIEGKGPPPLPASDPPILSSPTAVSGFKDSSGSSSTPTAGTQQVIQRRKKPKRRSTGVVHLGDLDKLDDYEEESETDEEGYENISGDSAKNTGVGGSSSGGIGGQQQQHSSSANKFLHPNNAQLQAANHHQHSSSYHNKSMDKDNSHNGDIDYKKLWEESQLENSRLREELSKSEDTRGRLEGALNSASKTTISEADKREKRALEKKLSEMEEELKQIEHLKNEIQRLRDENGALIRVISKLSK